MTAIASIAGAMSVMAASGGMIGTTGQVNGGASMIEQIHGCHRSAQDGVTGWHRHVGPNCRKVDSAPEERNPYARCRTKCNYIGPIKQCRRVCD
ncbi:MAG: hypothetical protein ABL904_11530 [Hyphomicrobiaceae bacterium]